MGFAQTTLTIINLKTEDALLSRISTAELEFDFSNAILSLSM